MSKLDKAKERIKSIPKDYTYSEAKALLISLGFVEFNKGKTSGSRVKFYRMSDGQIFLLHKPHPSNVIKAGRVKELAEFLMNLGEI